MKKLFILISVLFSLNAFAQQELQFEIQHNGQCTGQPCDTTFTYSVYTQGSSIPLVTSDTNLTPAIPFAIELGTEYCFEATATNSGGESARGGQTCNTWVSTPPTSPIILSIPVVFN